MPDAANDRPDEAALARLLDDCPERGTLWRHYKGDTVRVCGRALREGDLAPLVIYAHPHSPVMFVRPLSEWREDVTHEGRRVRRFEPVGE